MGCKCFDDSGDCEFCRRYYSFQKKRAMAVKVPGIVAGNLNDKAGEVAGRQATVGVPADLKISGGGLINDWNREFRNQGKGQ